MSLESHVLLLDGGEVLLELIDLLHVLVLYSEVLQLRLHLTNAVLQLVLLLDIHDELIEVLFQADDLLVDAHRDLVFLGLVEDELLDISVKALDTLDNALCVTLDLTDLIKNALDLSLLGLEVDDDLIDTLQVLISVEILGHLRKFSLHVLEGLFLMIELLDSLLDLLLNVLDLIGFVLVLNSFIVNLLFFLEDLFINGFLVLFPLVSELLQLSLHTGYLTLEHSQVLSTELSELL